MLTLKTLKALGPIDLKNVQRDPLLRWMPFLPLLVAPAVRWLLPALLVRLQSLFAFDLMGYFPPLMSYMLVMLAPLLSGMVVGFLLLDQRDDQTLTALQITPLSLQTYLVYRLSMPMLASILVTLIMLPIAGLAIIPGWQMLLAALCAAPLAPLYALALAGFAQNKVQGFALQKMSGIVLLPPLLAYFIDSNWQLALGIFPTYWPAKVLWAFQSGQASAWISLLIGIAYQTVLIGLLLKRFNGVMHR